jgi:hypothetical protein
MRDMRERIFEKPLIYQKKWEYQTVWNLDRECTQQTLRAKFGKAR